jgi:hypothetical protein
VGEIPEKLRPLRRDLDCPLRGSDRLGVHALSGVRQAKQG